VTKGSSVLDTTSEPTDNDTGSPETYTVCMLRRVVSDGRTRQAVSNQYNRALPDTADKSMQRPDPVRAAWCLPVLLLKSMVFRMLDSPFALPVLGARVVKSGNE
jgi:hypothetical protein